MFFLDPTMILLIPAMLLALWAQYRFKSTFTTYSKVPAASGLTGAQAARRLLDASGLSAVALEETRGRLSDHYDPRSRVLRLSADTARSSSVAALGVAAHEVGHAVQHQAAYAPFSVRQAVFPVASFGSAAAFPLFLAGFFFAGSFAVLMDIGIVLFAGAVLFHLVTLPVELNASSRALVLLGQHGQLVPEEQTMARRVLNAAALTYIAAAAVSVMHLLRLVLLRGMRD
ncbi:zinc metallopeptidase [bacterium]|nr:zinc metallopeptidase [bacterium]